MPEGFDPYHRWLGIPANERPAHHYRLLGLSLWESDLDVIRDAVEQRMAHVRTYQLGQHQELSQKILNELAAAKACLLDPQKKAAYDQRLRAELAAAGPQAPPPTEVSPPLINRVAPSKPPWPVLAAIAAGMALVCLVGGLLLLGGGKTANEVVKAQDEQNPKREQPVDNQEVAAGPGSPSEQASGQPSPSPTPSDDVATPSAPRPGSNTSSAVEQETPRAPGSKSELTPPDAMRPDPGKEPVPLFDGKTLDGWHLNSPGGPKCWSVDGGELVCTPRQRRVRKNLISDPVFGDFELHLEFLMESGANSGVYLRGLYEVQLLDDDASTAPSKQRCGAIYNRFAPSERAYFGPGQWNTLDVKMVGQLVTVAMNGKRIIRDAIVAGATDNKDALSIQDGDPGPIMLQCYAGGTVRFRNISIKRIGD